VAWRSTPTCQISPLSVQEWGMGPKKTFLKIKLCDVYKICRACRTFYDALPVIIWMHLLEVLQNYGSFKLMGLGSH